MMQIYNSFMEELLAMFSGKFIPYHKASLLIAVIVCSIFSMIFSHGTVFEGNIAVVDLDNSNFSKDLIHKIDASTYIDVKEVFHQPMPINSLTANDRNLGILYIPKGASESVIRSKANFNIGYYADYSNEAQNAEVIATINEIIGELNAELSVPKIAPISNGQDNSIGIISPMRLITRSLYNPTHTSTNSTVISFLFFFCSMYLTLSMLMLVGRLKVTGRWKHALSGSPIGLISRTFPYILFYVTSVTLMIMVLVIFGQLRFSGNYFSFLPSLFMTGLGFGLLGLILSWTTSNPGQGASRMIFLVPPGFITGGATMAVGLLPIAVYYLSYTFPLVWLYRFFRDFGLRGESIKNMIFHYGLYSLYLLFLAIIVSVLFYREKNKLHSVSMIENP